MMYATWWSHFSLFSNSSKEKKALFQAIKTSFFLLWRQHFFIFVLMGDSSCPLSLFCSGAKKFSFLSSPFLLDRSTHIVNNQHFPLYRVLLAASFLFFLHMLLDGWWCDVLGDVNSFLFVPNLFLQMFVSCLVVLSFFFSLLPNTIIIPLSLLPSDVVRFVCSSITA